MKKAGANKKVYQVLLALAVLMTALLFTGCGKPQAAGFQNADQGQVGGTCTLYVECAAILDHMDDLKPGKEDLVPADGVIYERQTVTFYEGDSVYDVLNREMQAAKIHMETSFGGSGKVAYVEGINNLYEHDCGRLSGWMYSVNDSWPNQGCSNYMVEADDVIEWHYTCDLGEDLGQHMDREPAGEEKGR